MKNTSGFTLIELMVVTLLIGALLSVALPSLKYLSEPALTKMAARELHSALLVARAEGARWNSVACVCPSTDSNSCSGNGEWEKGWIAFVNSSSNCVLGAGDNIVKSWDGTDIAWDGTDGITIRNNNGSITTDNFIRFSPRGRAILAGGGAQNGLFTICDTNQLEANADGDARYARGVDLHATGRARIIKTAAVLDATNCP